MFSPRGLLRGLNLEPNHARDEWKTGVHREACISAMKRQYDYQAVKRHSVRPMTPDPWSSVSKRNFEKEVRQWRLGIKALRAALYVEPMYIDVTFDAVDFDGGDVPWPSDLPRRIIPEESLLQHQSFHTHCIVCRASFLVHGLKAPWLWRVRHTSIVRLS